MRTDGRQPGEMRPVTIRPHFQLYPEGSCLVEFGNTKVICSANVEDRVPHFQRGTGQGWITAEYGMLPGATHQRTAREASRGKQTGRTQEIQRLVGRSLRCVADLSGIPDMTVWVDCDVLQADGGTRTAAITGSYVALVLALEKLKAAGVIAEVPVRARVAAVSVGILGGEKLLDLKYDEDSAAEVDMNVVMTDDGRMIEIQGTAEREPFTKDDLDAMLALAARGAQDLFRAQEIALEAARKEPTEGR